MNIETKAQELAGTLLDAMKELVTLNIHTVQGEVELPGTAAATTGSHTVVGADPSNGAEESEQPSSVTERRNYTMDRLLTDMPIAPERVVSTSINLMQGDVRNVVPTDFFEPAQRELRDYHLQQVEIAQKIIDQNLKAVATVVQLWRGSGTP